MSRALTPRATATMLEQITAEHQAVTEATHYFQNLLARDAYPDSPRARSRQRLTAQLVSAASRLDRLQADLRTLHDAAPAAVPEGEPPTPATATRDDATPVAVVDAARLVALRDHLLAAVTATVTNTRAREQATAAVGRVVDRFLAAVVHPAP